MDERRPASAIAAMLGVHDRMEAFEALGVPSYWVVDPAVPDIIAWELVGGAYTEVGYAAGDQVVELTRPFPVRIVPQELVP